MHHQRPQVELDWDGEPLFQFARVDRHREVALGLLDAGAPIMLSDDRPIAAMREKANAEGRPQSSRVRGATRSKEAPGG